MNKGGVMSAIRHLLTINAPPERIYKALTEEEGLQSWWTENAKARPEIGSVAVFDFGARFHNEMKIDELVPPERVVWTCIKGDEEWLATHFTFEITRIPGGSELRFAHTNWREETDFFASCSYNWAYYLSSLKEYCEKGEGRPYDGN